MAVIRLGAVDYLNARPLVYGLDQRPDLFALRFDPPSTCAALLHEGAIDVGMIPSIEFQRGVPPYRIVGGMGIVSDGPVASVALFSAKRPPRFVRLPSTRARGRRRACSTCCAASRWALRRSWSRCRRQSDAMLQRCDAALVIGDPALYLDHQKAGLSKIDLGEQWTA